MSPFYAYIVVEGPHDLEVVARLLKPLGIKRITLLKHLDPYWDALVPRKFPHGDDLLKRVPVPVFFKGAERSLAIHAAGGDTRIASSVEETLITLAAPPRAIGAILDADVAATPAERHASLQQKLSASTSVRLPDTPGKVAPGPPRCGAFVLPDNTTRGTLEDLLLECASTSYPSLLGAARALVGGIDPDDESFVPADMVDFTKPAGRNKATLACIAGVLRPGKAVQVSIQDNRWLDGAALELPRIAALRAFVYDLLEL
jgi:hypothetical protein